MRPCESLNVFFDPDFRVDVCTQLQRVVDGGWAEYLDKLQQAGVEDYLWAYQEAYNNVNGL